ncbi:MAG: MotA/TolQ/ExbB proton channel family protein [Planctomycetota bacterium]
MKTPVYLFVLTALASLTVVGVAQETPETPATPGAASGEAGVQSAATPVFVDEDPLELVRVDWVEEMVEGGVTMVFLGLLSVLLVAFAIERVIVMRARKFVPPGFAEKVGPMFLKKDYDGVVRECRKQPSTLAKVVEYWVDHRHADPQQLSETAGDLGARDILNQEQRTVPFAVIAALAPLLGLLGTMIGMIEAFKLVEVFGDEGGASMLAGSISKALITTAVGLILSIPAIACYHLFKHRLHVMGQRLEEETERLYSSWFVTPKRAATRTAPAQRPTPAAPKPAPVKPADPRADNASRTAPAARPA